MRFILSILLLLPLASCANPQYKSPEQVALEREQWEETQRSNKVQREWFKSLTPEQQVEVYKARLEAKTKMHIQQEQTRGVIMDSALEHVYQPLKNPVQPYVPMDNPYADAIRNGVYSRPYAPCTPHTDIYGNTHVCP